MKVTTYETHYMKNMVLLWSTIYETHYMKNKVLLWSTSVEKRDSNIVPSLFFSQFFGPSLFYGLFFVRSLILTCGGIISPSSFPHLGQCSNNDDHHTFIFLQLNNYNSIFRTKYDSIWMPPAVYRDMQWLMSDMYERIMNGGFATNTMSTTSC